MRRLTVAMLCSLGYSVTEASNAREALARLREPAEVDLLLTDVVLPGSMNGPALAATATESNPDLRVLYMSGYARDATFTDERALLEKPFTLEQLALHIQDSLADGPTQRQ